MPLRDHFRSPVDDVTSWGSFHAQWPAMIVHMLARKLPRRYIAAPRVSFGSSMEIDVATLEKDELDAFSEEAGNGGGVSMAVWAPPQPTLTVATELASPDEFEVRIYDSKDGRRLVAAIEIVSPANKDRPENRRAFVAKCAALLRKFVSVIIVDLVTTRHFNLYAELLELLDHRNPSLEPKPPPLYVVACRIAKKAESRLLETWTYPLTLGQSLPTLPLWLADNFAMPLELEPSYEETCHDLRIP